MPTALELTREEWQPYIDAIQRRPTPPKLSLVEKQEREQILARVYKVAVELQARFGASRVILFGSLANVDWFTSDSDVDLAVEGVSADEYWQAWRLAEDIIGDRSVDLVDVETAKDSLLRAIEQHGIEL